MGAELELSKAYILEAARPFRARGGDDADVVLLGEGQLSIAALVDGVVVRLPRSDFARGCLRREVSILERIRPLLGDVVPDVLGHDLDAPVGRAFVAHRFLPGAPLTADRVARLGATKLTAVAGAIAGFMREVHGLAHAVSGLSLPAFTNEDFARSLRDEVERLLAPRMSEGQRARAGAELDGVARLPSNAPALCHTDIGGNVLYDDATGNVSFIDFGGAMIADPVLDVASLSVLGPKLLARCGDVYPLVNERSEDAGVVRATFALQDALYGARQDDWSYADEVLAGY